MSRSKLIFECDNYYAEYFSQIIDFTLISFFSDIFDKICESKILLFLGALLAHTCIQNVAEISITKVSHIQPVVV